MVGYLNFEEFGNDLSMQDIKIVNYSTLLKELWFLVKSEVRFWVTETFYLILLKTISKKTSNLRLLMLKIA